MTAAPLTERAGTKPADLAIEGLVAALRGTSLSRAAEPETFSAELPVVAANITTHSQGALGKLRVKAAERMQPPAAASDLETPKRGRHLLEALREHAQTDAFAHIA